MQKKQHSILGIASCVIFLIWLVGGYLFFPRSNFFLDLSISSALGALTIYGAILGILSFLQPNTKRLFGCIGLLVNGLPLLCVGGYALLSYPTFGR